MIRTSRRLGFINWYIVNPVRVSADGMVFMWLSGIQIESIFIGEGTIDLGVGNVDIFTFVYGLREDQRRYDEFNRIAISKRSSNIPRLLGFQ